MADTKISAEADGAPALLTDEVVIARSGANFKLAVQAIISLAEANPGLIEAIQDSIGGMMTSSATVDTVYDDVLATITSSVKDGSITLAKMENRTASRLIGRGQGSGTGSPQEISIGAGLTLTGTTLTGAVGTASDGLVDVTQAPYGCVGDGVTDDTTALQSAFSSGSPLRLPSGKEFRVSSPLTLSSSCLHFDMTGAQITFTTGITTAQTVMTVGSNAATMSKGIYRGMKIRRASGSPAWSGNVDNAILRFININNSLIEVLFLDGYMTCGLQIKASAASGTRQSLYNTVLIGQILSCQYDLVLHSDTAGCAPNQNMFLGGSLRIAGSVNVTQDAASIWYTFGTGGSGAGYTSHNNNVHLQYSCELNPGGAGRRVPHRLDCGQRNMFLYFRSETLTDTQADITGTATNNYFDVLYTDGTYALSDTSNNRDSVLVASGRYPMMGAIKAWDSGQLSHRVCHYSATALTIRGVGLAARGSNSYTNEVSASFAAVRPSKGHVDILSNNVAFSVFVDCRLHKQFRILRQSKTQSGGGRIGFNVYDQYFAAINQSTFPTAGVGHLDAGSFNTSTFGGTNLSKESSTNTNGAAVVCFDSTVHYARILWIGGSVDSDHVSLGLQAIDATIQAPLVVWADNVHGDNTDFAVAADIPLDTYGFYPKGYVVRNDGTSTSLSATAAISWVNNTLGRLAPPRTDSTSYSADVWMASGVSVYWARVGGVTNSSVPGTLGTTYGTDYSDSTVVWRYDGPLAVFRTLNGNVT